MNAKTIVLLLAGMCASFAVVLYVMYVALAPDQPRPAPRRTAVVRPSRAPEPGPTRAVPRPGQVTPGTAGRAGSPASAPASAPPAITSAASPQITQLKQELDQQIVLLKKERDQMLSELVRQLSGMPASQAAGQLRHVDDEVAALALARMTAAQRQAILDHLDPRRARLLTQTR